jgi:hypothetical protein
MTDYQHEKTLQDHRAWLGTLSPEGLVVSPAVMADAQVVLGLLEPERQRLFTSLTARRGDVPEGRELTPEQADEFFIPDIPRFLTDFLGWPADLLIGASQEQPIPDALRIPLPELHEELVPTYALRDPKPKDAARPWLILIKALPIGTDLDKESTGDSAAWTASPSRRFERLLRETGVPIGLVTAGTSLRLVYAPRGESAGTLTFPIGFMREVAGRRVLAALEMLLGRQCLLAAPTPARLPTLLAKSRDFQASVSTALAQQVIDAAFELVRGFQAANEKAGGTLLETVLATRPNEVYEGLLTVLMRMVFTLYAEDRGLLPSSSLYQQHYGVHGLFERLRGDAAKHPDTMDLRYGAWAQLVALFRLIHSGSKHPDLKLPARSGYLFDPERFPWLEGRTPAGGAQKVPAVPDGTIHRVLEKLLVLDGERLSYRTLDVEQIGSVYEVMMGFGVGLADGPSIAIKPKKKHGAPVPVNLDALLATKPADRTKTFEAQTDHKLTAKQADPLKAATTIDGILAALETAKKISRSATPQPVAKGGMLLVPSDERRRSGSNYTPRKLTEPIVRKTLEPVLANLGEKPTPAQLLDLKICDPAMGSGAFLVEACRQLADHLVVAWQRHGGMPPVPPDEDELLLAKRLVAQKCLYGVDKNPVAADLAKLSLWLATLAKDHPFTFLDHSLRSGDSLVGLGRKQIASLHWEPQKQRTTVTKALEDAISRAAKARREILEGGDFLSPELKAQKLEVADDALSKPRLIGDAVIAAFFSAEKPKDRQKTLDRLSEPVEEFLGAGAGAGRAGAGDYVAARLRIADLVNWLHGKPRDAALAASDDALAPDKPISHPLKAFHWEIEFPEAFGRENPGFDAIVGNPPFAGKNTFAASAGDIYPDWLKVLHEDSHGNADVVAHFFRRAFALLRGSGAFGLIATNTIAQGDSRSTGLRIIRRRGGIIYDATRRLLWPGDAAVVVSVIHIAKTRPPPPYKLDGRAVPLITAFLFAHGGDEDPFPLNSNNGRAYVGTYVLGMGFVFDDCPEADDTTPDAPWPLCTMEAVLAQNPSNKSAIFPYIGGEEFNNSPTHCPARRVINLEELDERTARTRFPELMRLLEVKAKRSRSHLMGRNAIGTKRATYWWIHASTAKELYRALEGRDTVPVRALTSKHFNFSVLPSRLIYDQTLILFAFPPHTGLCVLSNRTHEAWSQFFGGTLKDDPRYNVEDCFETFPFPENFETNPALEAAGKAYYEYRAALMVEHDEGLTKTYNRFHDPAESNERILRLRELHAAMDRAVLVAYGWHDVPTACGFALDWLDLDDDELADTLASAPDDIRERIESADYVLPDAAAACRFQSHIKQSGKGKLPWRYRWPDEVRDDVLARLLALNAKRAELERLTGLPGTGNGVASAAPADTDSDDSIPATAPKAKPARKASKRASKKSVPRPMFDE